VRGVNSEAVVKEISSHISSQLDSVGLMYRIFSRAKATASIDHKLAGNPLYGVEKKIQDLIGIRVVLYFNDDIETVRGVVSNLFEEREADLSIDEFKKDEFRAVRYNIVYSLPDELVLVLNLGDKESFIDATFELQIRTIFSEGWHEVEHDLRYKCKKDWDGFDFQSRKLNGVYASLETSEWTMIKIFDELAYNHYKKGEWPAMFRQKLRLRILDEDIEDELIEILEDKEVAKKFYRLDRAELISLMCKKEFCYPLTINNIIYFSNMHFVRDVRIDEITPGIMIEEMSGA
jgi:putative GTP pyrophosphokinase